MEKLNINYLALDQIEPSATNPRKSFDAAALTELAESIKQSGVLQPIIVRKSKQISQNTYEVVAGERRLRAALMVKLSDKSRDTIPAIIRDLNDDEVMEIQIVENLQRKDVHPMEEAAGFKNILEFSKMQSSDIAARVGKTTSYITQRLKLNDLIDELQTAFYNDQIRITDALKLAKLSPIDQQEMFDDHIQGLSENEVADISNYDFQAYHNDLAGAKFDINDALLMPAAGACINCPYNSAYNTLLFPDQAQKQICNNTQCYKLKHTLSFNIKLQEAVDDPATVLVSKSYGSDSEEKEIKQKHKVYHRNEFDEIELPEEPRLIDFSGNNEDPKDDEHDFIEAMDDYKKDMAKYNKDIEGIGVVRALVVAGHNKGEFVFGKVNSKPSNGTQGVASSDPKQAIESEIYQIKQKTERQKQLDENKAWDQFKGLVDPDKKSMRDKLTNKALSPVEFDLLMHSFHKSVHPMSEFGEMIVNLVGDENEEFFTCSREYLNQILRMFIFDKLYQGNLVSGFNTDAKAAIRLAAEYFPDDYTKIKTELMIQHETRDKKAEKSIDVLQQKLSEYQPVKKAKSKKSVKLLISNPND